MLINYNYRTKKSSYKIYWILQKTVGFTSIANSTSFNLLLCVSKL
jgi:hypothetical protein